MRKIGFWKGIFCFKKQACGNPGPKGRFLGEGNGNREAAESFCSGVNIMDCRTGCGWRFLLIDYYSQCQSLSHVQLFVAPWTVAHQAALSMEFSRQEYWDGLPFPSPGDLPTPGNKGIMMRYSIQEDVKDSKFVKQLSSSKRIVVQKEIDKNKKRNR